MCFIPEGKSLKFFEKQNLLVKMPRKRKTKESPRDNLKGANIMKTYNDYRKKHPLRKPPWAPLTEMKRRARRRKIDTEEAKEKA